MTKEKPQPSPEWNNLILRLQAASSQKEGVVFINVKIVAQNGVPHFWLPPEVIPVEPRVNISIDDIVGKLSESQLVALLSMAFSGS